MDRALVCFDFYSPLSLRLTVLLYRILVIRLPCTLACTDAVYVSFPHPTPLLSYLQVTPRTFLHGPRSSPHHHLVITCCVTTSIFRKRGSWTLKAHPFSPRCRARRLVTTYGVPGERDVIISILWLYGQPLTCQMPWPNSRPDLEPFLLPQI